MFGAIYLALLPLLAYISGNKDSIKVLTLFCSIVLFDLILTDLVETTLGDNFFLYRAIVGLILLFVISRQLFNNTKRYLTCFLISLVVYLNIYLCFELDNVLVYRYWETINLVISELIIIILIAPDKVYTMFTSIKAYIYGAMAAVGLFLLGMLKYLSHKNDKLKQEIVIEKKNVVVLEKQKQQTKELNQALSDVRKEADEVSNENNKRASTRTRPSGSFSDPRLRNKD